MNKLVSEKNPNGTSSLFSDRLCEKSKKVYKHPQTACLTKSIQWNEFHWYEDSLSEKLDLFIFFNFMSTISQKDFHKRKRKTIVQLL